MSRSKKDGRHGGGHRNTTGKEYWGTRGGRKMSMATPGRFAKTRTHRIERQEARRIERAEGKETP